MGGLRRPQNSDRLTIARELIGQIHTISQVTVSKTSQVHINQSQPRDGVGEELFIRPIARGHLRAGFQLRRTAVIEKGKDDQKLQPVLLNRGDLWLVAYLKLRKAKRPAYLLDQHLSL